MGGFYLVHDSDPARFDALRSKISQSFEAQGFGEVRRIRRGSLELGVYRKRNVAQWQIHRAADGDFACFTGTPLLDGLCGEPAARCLLRDVDTGSPDWERLTGQLCAVVLRGGDLTLFTDRLGIYKVYCDRDNRVFSSSFLAVAECVEARTGDAQGVYEYVFQEATYGHTTVLEEVRLAQTDGRYRFAEAVQFERWSGCPLQDMDEDREDRTLDDHVAACLERLRAVYAGMALAFGDSIDTALSGGYDSRLTLGLLQQQGVVPKVHVYGRSHDADVRIAKAIAQGEGFSLTHVDKHSSRDINPERYAQCVETNFHVFDGYPPAGIFDDGVDLSTRLERCAHGELMLNGGGGEIFRNFFYLLDRAMSVRRFLWCFYNRFDPAACTDLFDEEAYHARLGGKVKAAVRSGDSVLKRREIEYLYPAFRCRYWMGRNNQINNRLGWALTPFMDYELVRCAVGVPLRFKNHGRLQAAMIRAVSPELARYTSDYGHGFIGRIPFTRLARDYSTLLRPPRMRRYAYRLRYRRPRPRPRFLSGDYLRAVLDPRLPRLGAFFRIDGIHDPAAFTRVCTLEYLFEKLNVAIPGR